MRRERKGFSGVETPLFKGMIVEQVIEEGRAKEEHVEDDTAAQEDDTTVQEDAAQEPSIPSPTPPIQQPQDLPLTSQVHHTPPQSPQPQPQPQPQAQHQAVDFPMSLLQEALDACAALTRRVEHLEYDKVAQALEITKLQKRVKMLEKGNMVKVLKLQRLKKVGTSQRIDTPEDTVMEDASNQGRMIDDLDKDDDDVSLMGDKEEEAKVVKDDQDEPAEVHEVVDVVTTAKLITKVVTAASETITAASTIISAAASIRVAAASTRRIKGVGKGIMVEEPKPLKKKQQVKMDEEYARKLHAELNKDIEWDTTIDHEENRAIQSINETSTQKAAKRRKLNEEVEDLKRHLEIVPDEDDDVYTEATPLARKVHVVDYEIIHLNNKPHYNIIRADGTHQLPDGHAQVWKNQRTVHGQAKVKS
nr:hypothetical protein [Tanacetum cinerariifolium]